MRYLFFDLEFATSRNNIHKICEFGYVLTDESFNVLKKENIIINPNIRRCDWDYNVVNKILTRSIKEYESKPIFIEFYEKIKDIILSSDKIFGHTLDNDTKALNDECKRYKKECINYNFYDVKDFYKEFLGTDKSIGLSAILEELNIKGDLNVHDALCDAYNTMLVLKEMLNRTELTLDEFLSLLPFKYDENLNFKIKSHEILKEYKKVRYKDYINDGTNDILENSDNFYYYIDFFKKGKREEYFSNKLDGKKVSISPLFEKHHFKESINLLSFILNNGGKISYKLSDSNIFIKYDICDQNNNLVEDYKLDEVYERKIKQKKIIDIYSFDEFLNYLNIKKEVFLSCPLAQIDYENDEEDNDTNKHDVKNKVVYSLGSDEKTEDSFLSSKLNELLKDFN